MIDALKAHAAKHFQSYFIAMLLGLSGWLVAIYDNFWSVEPHDMQALGWWQVVALAAKCMAGGVVPIIGYMIKSPLDKPSPPEHAPANHPELPAKP